MSMRKRKSLLALVLLIVVLGALSLTGAALAQSSVNYDLGCWRLLSAGGDVHSSTNYTLKSSFGQWMAGPQSNANSKLNAGYVQNWIPAAPLPPGPPPSGAFILYAPLIGKYFTVERICSY